MNMTTAAADNANSRRPDGALRDFIRVAVQEDLASGRYRPPVITRFPPEPNGYLHIGHAKAMCIDFLIAEDFDGYTNLRFDDTNPVKEEQEYIDAIKQDVAWLGFSWKNECYASDYFEQLYQWALALIKVSAAYVDDQSADEIRAARGTLTEPGRPSPFRDRTPQENLDLFERMKSREFPDGSRVLRAKIDMAAGNLVMRDPVLYRILHAEHPRTAGTWCVYPMYDWAHGQSDWVEGVTHSLCDISFEIHRPLYEWCIERLAEAGAYPAGVEYKPRQIEFARGNITYMVTSKRRLFELIDAGIVSGWDDPRMPTLCGLRRRGFTPSAIRRFWLEAGIAKRENNIEIAKLETCLRDDLNRTARRVMAVLEPLKVVITNYPEDRVEHLSAVNNPEDESAGSRQVPFSRELYIEHDDFMEDPPRKFFRLAPGREVRLRYAYWITCQEVVKDAAGNPVELRCTYDPETRGGDAPPPGPDGKRRKVKGTLHWVSAPHAIDAEIRLYDHLFSTEDPGDVPEGGNWLDNVNPESLKVLTGCKLEPALAEANPAAPYQFERQGYFVLDPDSSPGEPVFNRTIGLRDTWAKIGGGRRAD